MVKLTEMSNKEIDTLKPHLVPALKHNDTVHVGRRGETHAEVYSRAMNKHNWFTRSDHHLVQRGFYHIPTKKFHSDTDTGPLDSTDLMSPSHRVRKYATEESKNGLRIKKVGPLLHFVFGPNNDHVGNVISPTLGGDKKKAQQYTARAKHWGKQAMHPTKALALKWLKDLHINTMKTESATTDDTTHDLLRENGWIKNRPPGNTSQIAKYTHHDLPGHHINVSYTNDTWRHHTDKADSTPHVGMGTRSLHGYLNTLHSAKTIDGIKEFIQHIQEEYPDDWREVVVEFIATGHLKEGPEQEFQGETPRSLEKKAIHRSKVNIMKTKPYGNIPEEFFDKEKNEKDPKAGPKPKPSNDAESEVKIKKTMTGEPGPTIAINPKMMVVKPGQDTFTAPDSKKRPSGT